MLNVLPIKNVGAVAVMALSLVAGLSASPQSLASPVQDKVPLRVISYNVKLGFAMKQERKLGKKKLAKKFSMARMIKKHERLKNFDILGVQEICTNQGGWQLEYFNDFLRQEYGGSWMSVAREDPDTSFMCERASVIFSRYPITNSGVIQLPRINQARSVAWADIEIPGEEGRLPIPLRVYNAHFDTEAKGMSDEAGRLLQARAVIEHIREWREQNPFQPVILMGDLNSLGKIWDPWRREAAILELSKTLHPTLKGHHHTHVVLPHMIDWIFYDTMELVRSKVVYKLLSDHYPVAADFLLSR
jgi:endonuclease/exonuclease/phosphatase family metal-dependent hydrolase